MKVTRFERSRFHGRVWPSFAAKGGAPALREDKWWRRWRNWNGVAFNRGQHSYWVEFRRTR